MKMNMPIENASSNEIMAPAERAALALESSKTEVYLRELAAKHVGITEAKNKAGRDQAHGAAMECARARITVEKAAKEVRDDATKFSKAVIAEEKRLVEIVKAEEDRLKAVRDAWDNEQARIQREAEEARMKAESEEQERIQAKARKEQEDREAAYMAELSALQAQQAEAARREREAAEKLAEQQAELERLKAELESAKAPAPAPAPAPVPVKTRPIPLADAFVQDISALYFVSSETAAQWLASRADDFKIMSGAK